MAGWMPLCRLVPHPDLTATSNTGLSETGIECWDGDPGLHLIAYGYRFKHGKPARASDSVAHRYRSRSGRDRRSHWLGRRHSGLHQIEVKPFVGSQEDGAGRARLDTDRPEAQDRCPAVPSSGRSVGAESPPTIAPIGEGCAGSLRPGASTSRSADSRDTTAGSPPVGPGGVAHQGCPTPQRA